MEGPGCLGDRPCDPAAHIAPAIAYPHVAGDEAHCAVIGGYAYRGGRATLPQGTYLYGDYCSGTIWAVPVADLLAGDGGSRSWSAASTRAWASCSRSARTTRASSTWSRTAATSCR